MGFPFSPVNYSIKPGSLSYSSSLKKNATDTATALVRIGVRVCAQTCARTRGRLHEPVCAWHHLKHIPNCKWFSHNTSVNEPEMSIGASSGSQVGNLLVYLSGEDTKLVLILMNNSAVTSARLLHSLQRLVQVTDCTPSTSHRICT